MSKQKALAFGFLFALTLAIETFISKIALNRGADPLIFSVEVLVLTSVLLALLALTQPKVVFKNITKKRFLGVMMSGIVGLGLGTIIGKFGLKLSTAVNYGFLFKSSLIFSALYGYFLFREKIGKHFIFLSFLFTIGCYLVLTNGQLLKPHLGDILIILSALCISTGSSINKLVLNKDVSPLFVSFVRVAAGAVFWTIIIYLFFPTKWYLSFIAIAFIQSIFAVGSQLFLNSALKFGDISLFSLIGMAMPLMTAALGIGILKESMGLVQALGAIIILVSSVLLIKKYR